MAGVHKNPEVDGEQLLSELEWTYMRTSGGHRTVVDTHL